MGGKYRLRAGKGNIDKIKGCESLITLDNGSLFWHKYPTLYEGAHFYGKNILDNGVDVLYDAGILKFIQVHSARQHLKKEKGRYSPGEGRWFGVFSSIDPENGSFSFPSLFFGAINAVRITHSKVGLLIIR